MLQQCCTLPAKISGATIDNRIAESRKLINIHTIECFCDRYIQIADAFGIDGVGLHSQQRLPFVMYLFLLQLKLMVVEALGRMAYVMSQHKLEEQFPRLLPAILNLYRRNIEPYSITVVSDAFISGDVMFAYYVLMPSVPYPITFFMAVEQQQQNVGVSCTRCIKGFFIQRFMACVLLYQ